MASIYTIPNAHDDLDDRRQNKEEKSLQNIEELPNFLRRMIRLSPTRWKKTFTFMAILTQVGFGGTIFTYITSSPIIGLVIGILFFFADCTNLLQPDFNSGVFLDVLLQDTKTAKKINDNIFNATVSMCIIFPLLFTPLAWYFFMYPLALTKLLGESTYIITMVAGGLATLAVLPYSVLCSTQPLSDQVSVVHIQKIEKYLSRVRSIILGTDVESHESSNIEVGMSLVDRLSHEQAQVEKWIIAINKGMATFNSLLSFSMLSSVVITLIIVASMNSVGPIMFIIALALFMWVMFSNTLYALAKPNMVWEQQKILLLNDAKVILNLKFPKENFESWLDNHNINAARVFGTKLTFEKMRQATGALTSVFGVVLYLLLRDDLKGLA
eukprot:g2204.t1